MKLAASATLTLAALSRPAGGVCFESYTDTGACTGAITRSECAPASTCFDINEGDFVGSAIVTCSSSDAGADWTYQVYEGRDCVAGEITATFSGSGNDDCTDPGDSRPGFTVDCSASCFSGAATVSLESGVQAAVRDLRAGDRVMAADAEGGLFYDRVFRVSHHDDEAPTRFVRIRTESGRELELSPGHMLHVGECCSLDAMRHAADVREGDLVFAADAGRAAAEPDTVTRVERVERAGAYNVHTLSGQIAVSGVAASHHTSESTWTRKSLAPLWYRVVDFFSF